MPRVTDFPDQQQTMLNAVLNNRAMNLQADQTYLDVAAQSEQLRQSMLAMVMDDAFSRDALAEDARQFDSSLELEQDRNLLGWAKLHEDQRSNLSNEGLLGDQIELAKDRLRFDETTQQRSEQLQFLDTVSDNLASLSQAYATIDSLEQKRQRTGRLFGEDAENYDAARQTIQHMSGVGIRDMLNRGRIVGVDDQTMQSLGAGFNQYIQQGIPERDIPQEGLLDRTTYSQVPEEDRFGPLSLMMGRGGIHNIHRIASAALSGITGVGWKDSQGNQFNVPRIDAEMRQDLQKVIEGEKELTDGMRRRFNEQFNNWTLRGTHGFPTTSARARRDQTKTARFYESMIADNIAAEAAQRSWTWASQEERQTKSREEIKNEWLQNPLNAQIAYREGTPRKVRQAKVAAEKLDAVNNAITQLGAEAYSAMSKGEREAHVLAALDAVGFHGSSVNDLASIYRDFNNDNLFFFDESEYRKYQSLIENLHSDIGFKVDD